MTMSFVHRSSHKRRWALTVAFVCSFTVACTPAGSESAHGTGGQGGASSHGGAPATGGVTATGGTSSTAGVSGTGGTSATGGTASTGGVAATGGKTATGGTTSTGGAWSTGGVTTTGGTTPTGGVASQGGQSGQGGQHDASITDGPTATGGVGGQGGSVVPDATKDQGATGGADGSTFADAARDVPKLTSYNIMPFGDSITATMCPPQMLDQELKAKGHTNFTFVGTKVANQSCNGAPNTKCEGQGGIWATNLVPGGANPDLMDQWAKGSQYDVVLMHLGTNDCWSPGAVPDLQSVIDAFSYIIDRFRAANPSVIVFVAQIIPLNPANCTTCEARVEQLNDMIPAFVDKKTTAASPIYVADIHAAFDGFPYTPNSTNSTDGAHPTPAGSQLMADAWYAALQAHDIP
jgi:lysophospholipase L1-like esterase